jgi:serine/threonine-protein kinase
MSDAIPRLNAALEGRYRIERELGEGGMATVYLADDLKHERKVALKVLKPELAAVVGAERFLAEIKTTANLQHPHILPLFDSGEADSFLFYVMPYVEGESLREKLDREKQLGVDDALALAAKLCDALDYAHSEGVIHRDIKPANILLSKRGEPLVADFGIALAVAHAGGGRITETGLSLGTPHYMSPEQATGDAEVDPRSDVYALACVVYEMLAGEPPFTATTAQAILAKILTMDAPSITMVRRTVPSNVSAAVAKALEKLPADRFATVSDFAAALADPGFVYAARARTYAAASHPGSSAAPLTAAGIDRRAFSALAAVAALALGLAAWGWLRPTPVPEPGVPLRTALTGLDFSDVLISPRGDRFVARMASSGGLYTRTAGAVDWQPIPNTVPANNAAFSPDGEWITFNRGGEIWKVQVLGGAPLRLAAGLQPHWGDDDVIVYQRRNALYRIGASGGEPELLLETDSLLPQRPHLLPGGRAVIFHTDTGGDPLESRVFLLEIEPGEVRELLASGTSPRYVPTGHIVYAHGTFVLMGVPFDLESLEVTGPSLPLIGGVHVSQGGDVLFGLSSGGTMVYGAADGGTTAAASLYWVDLDGTRTPIPTEVRGASHPRVSPDGRSIAYAATDGQIWIHDVASGTDRQFTFEGTSDYPIWSTDGRTIYFLGRRPESSGWVGFRKSADGTAAPEPLWATEESATLTSISPDGRWLVLSAGSGQSDGRTNNDSDLWLFDLQADSADALRPYLETDRHESEAAVSPDGKWIAYWQGGNPGNNEVFVRGFPEPTGIWRVSGEENRSSEPTWSPDGGALYYVGEGGLVRVDVQTDSAFVVGPRTALPYMGNFPGGAGTPLDVHPDGTRFVVADGGGGSFVGDVWVVTNWHTELRERMGGDR